MNYEKKYKDALERAKKLYEQGTITETISYIFHEFAEPEDEKIRKRLIDFFEDWRETKSHLWGINVNKILAWLEKQGETFTKKDVDDAYLKGVSDTKHELGKQGEQKPAWSKDNNSFCKENCKGYQETGRCFADGDCKDKREAEQKPTLSEEDDMMIEETLYFLREYQQSNRCKDENGMQNSVSCEKWLKSLKERIGG